MLGGVSPAGPGWRLLGVADYVEAHVDPDDADVRWATVLCGEAVLRARAALAWRGRGSRVVPHPDPERPRVAAVVEGAEPDDTTAALARLAAWLSAPESSGGQVLLAPAVDRPLMDELPDLSAAASEEGATLRVFTGPKARTLATLITDERVRRGGDPPAPAYVDELANSVLGVLGTPRDRPQEWLVAGAALGRLRLAAARSGIVVEVLGSAAGPSGCCPRIGELARLAHPQLCLRLAGPGARLR